MAASKGNGWGDPEKGQPNNSSWRRWIVPGIFGLAFLGIAALRPPCACGPGACALPASAPIPTAGGSGGIHTPTQTGTDSPAGPEASAKTALLYLHGTVRCKTCIEIERVAEKTAREAFADALANGTLSWQSIDYELPENAEYDRRFHPPCPSLVVAALSADGKFGRWRILGRTWDLIPEGPQGVADYVRDETSRFIAEQAGGSTSPKGGESRAP